ncbi:Nitroreductase-like protein [Amylocarpus encephaloides]|uniref:Nitroreductase-like protein n=1 Tax=Amylocarpus encephaloides TaxID=45428 RepID=A0A9P8C2X9_9HELO|nr:Nitroreductase-like protein [Amylocarpus encephaloides]
MATSTIFKRSIHSGVVKITAPRLRGRGVGDIRACFPSTSTLHQQTTSTTKIKHFSTTQPTAKMSTSFLETVKSRRTIYQLSKSSPISDAKIQEIISQAILHVPSSFNSQSTRIVLLVKEEHDKLWEITKEILKAIVPADGWAATEGRLNGFKAAYGTVLFFEHRPTVSSMQEKFALYADKFPGWATQSDAMHQFTIWTALEAEGLGANLQHYNPLIDQKVQETWAIEKDWELNAQLVFGKPEGGPMEKDFMGVEGERFKVFGV